MNLSPKLTYKFIFLWLFFFFDLMNHFTGVDKDPSVFLLQLVMVGISGIVKFSFEFKDDCLQQLDFLLFSSDHFLTVFQIALKHRFHWIQFTLFKLKLMVQEKYGLLVVLEIFPFFWLFWGYLAIKVIGNGLVGMGFILQSNDFFFESLFAVFDFFFIFFKLSA